MKPAKIRRDRFGRTLAKSSRGRGREIVIATEAERIEPARMAALGVEMVSDDQQTVDLTNATPPAPAAGEEQTGEYPIDRGGGWFELSNGDRVRGEDDALAAEARLQGSEE